MPAKANKRCREVTSVTSQSFPSPTLRRLGEDRVFYVTPADVTHVAGVAPHPKAGCKEFPSVDEADHDELLASVSAIAASAMAKPRGRRKGTKSENTKISRKDIGLASSSDSTSKASRDKLLKVIEIPKPLLGPSELQQVYIVSVARALEEARRDMGSASPLSPVSSLSSSLSASQGATTPMSLPLHRKVASLIQYVHTTVLSSADDWWASDSCQSCVIAINASGGEIIGLCVSSQVEAAARVELTSGGSMPSKQDDVELCATANSAAVFDSDWASSPITLSDTWCKGCLCGINLIWTHPRWAGKGIARSLIDASRAVLVYGWEVPKEMVAFSHPTAEGKLLATRYSNRKDFLVFV